MKKGKGKENFQVCQSGSQLDKTRELVLFHFLVVFPFIPIHTYRQTGQEGHQIFLNEVHEYTNSLFQVDWQREIGQTLHFGQSKPRLSEGAQALVSYRLDCLLAGQLG